MAPKPAPASNAATTASCAEQGMANWRIAVEILFSRSLPSIRVVIVAIVTQPKPRMSGMTALPFKPIAFRLRSTNVARRGKYPLSSMTASEA
jgi:hypothetical protein